MFNKSNVPTAIFCILACVFIGLIVSQTPSAIPQQSLSRSAPASAPLVPSADQVADPELAAAIRITEFCAKLVGYAEAVAKDRERGIPRSVLLQAIPNTTLAYMGLPYSRVLAAATGVIDTLYDHPTLFAFEVTTGRWDACHQDLR